MQISVCLFPLTKTYTRGDMGRSKGIRDTDFKLSQDPIKDTCKSALQFCV